MVDWKSMSCELVGTARNGRQALESIENMVPDIVIADINMPVMNGIDLIKEVSVKWPHIVFLMLTNLQEFELAREALRYKAVDYITKAQLDVGVLEKCLVNAIKESEKRKTMMQVNLTDHYIKANHQKILHQAALEYLTQKNVSDESLSILQDAGALESYSAIHLWFQFPLEADNEDFQRLFNWETELVEKLAGNCFESFLLIETGRQHELYVLHWGQTLETNTHQVAEFYERLLSASNSITYLLPSLQVTDVCAGASHREKCQKQLRLMAEYAYLFGEHYIAYAQIPVLEMQPLNISGMVNRLKSELNSRSSLGVDNFFTRTISLIETSSHEKAQAVCLCSELYQEVYEISKAASITGLNEWLLDHSGRSREIMAHTTRSDVVLWLRRLSRETAEVLAHFSYGSLSIEQAKQFAIDNIGKKIAIQDAANHIGMSTSYFSTYFKKETGQNYIDYANTIKINKAQELIRNGGYRINEISQLLGFENAYYFSKVFRRYVGMSPTEYQHKVRK